MSNEFDEHPLSLSVDVVTPPTAMSLHMENSTATEYFATVEPPAAEPKKEVATVEVAEVKADEEEKVEPQLEKSEDKIEAEVKEVVEDAAVKRETKETEAESHESKEDPEEDKEYVQVKITSSITLPPKETPEDAPKDTTDEDAEEEAGARAIEEAKRTLEALDSKPQSPHHDPLNYGRSESFSHIPTAESASIPKDEDEVSIISDIQRPRVSESISRLERDIEISSAAASPRARTDSHSMRSPSSFSTRFRRDSSEFGGADESFESTGTSPGSNLKRPLSRSYSISSTVTVSSSKMDKSFEKTYDSLFSSPSSVTSPTSSVNTQSTQVYMPETPTPSGNAEKRRKPSATMVTVSSPNGEKKPTYRFASPTMASQTRERITRKTFQKTKSESHITPSKLPRKTTVDADTSMESSMTETPDRRKIVVKLPPGGSKKDEGVMTEPVLEEIGKENTTTTMTIAPYYTSTAVQTEYPSPPSSPFTFRSYSPVGRSRSHSRALEFESFQQSIDDAAGVDSKMAALIAMYDDAKTVDDLVESMENSMDLLEGSFRSSTPPHYMLTNGSARSGLTTMENSRILEKPLALTSTGPEDSTAIALITDGKERGQTAAEMSNIQLIRHFFGRNKMNLLWTFLAIVFICIAYYMQLVRIHRACGFADTYICTSGGRVCMMRPYRCY